MSASSFEVMAGISQIKPQKNLHIPDRAKVYVVIPDLQQPSAARQMSPRLAKPEQAKDFEMVILTDAGV